MNRTIKFRGRDMSGHFVYGLLTRKKIRSSGEVVFAIALSEKQSETIPVNENSIAQLVGYDKDGKEVYEGDIVIEEYLDDYTCKHIARLESMSQNPETAAYYFWTYPSKCKLEEATS